jgi:hypothetical protein
MALEALGEHSGKQAAQCVIQSKPVGMAKQPEECKLQQQQCHPPKADLN